MQDLSRTNDFGESIIWTLKLPVNFRAAQWFLNWVYLGVMLIDTSEAGLGLLEISNTYQLKHLKALTIEQLSEKPAQFYTSSTAFGLYLYVASVRDPEVELLRPKLTEAIKYIAE